MAYVVCQPCQGCKYTDCVVVCPMDCFYDAGELLVIDPENCIDCGACEPECPATAIYRADHVPGVWHDYIALNQKRSAELIQLGQAPITEKVG